MITLTDRATVSRYPEASGYPRRGEPRIVTVSPRRCLAVEGTGEPGGQVFQEAMGALYGAAYTLHFMLRERGLEAHVSPVEGLWTRVAGEQDWAEGPVAFDPTAWCWTLLIPLAEGATDAEIEAALASVARRQGPGAVQHLEVRTIDEGIVVEAMHVGPYATEPATIAAMHGLAAQHGLVPHGAHHEIYLGDPRRSKPENLRTVLRQPVG
ncbi:MAG TPA: GyrI-like domain-containing protein [Patescibacteria group bacterium]|jgi:hypothetical protein|nr:GyrI-like domain-containing protein [Patescibacteria group bacterium]